MKPTEEEDERGGFISGSKLSRAINCQGAHALELVANTPPPKWFTEAGTRIADLIDKLATDPDSVNDIDVDEEEMETALFLLNKKATKFSEICEEQGYNPDDFTVFHEERFWYTHEATPYYSGKLDTGAYHKTKPIAVVIDDKSGWMELPPPWMNDQLKSYALLLYQNVPHLTNKEVKIHVATNSRFWDQEATLDFDDLREFHAIAVNAIKAINLNPKPYGLPLRAGEWCRYCDARMECPLLRQGLVSIEGNYGPPVEIYEKIRQMDVPEIEAVLIASETVNFAVKAIYDEAERRIQKSPDEFKQFEYRSGPSRRVLVDSTLPEVASNLADIGVTGEEVLSCLRGDALTIGKTSKLEKLIYAKLNLDPDAKITHKDADEVMVKALGGFVGEKTPAPKLWKKKPPKKQVAKGKEVKA